MPTRRQFLSSISSTTAGIFFVGCSCVDSSLGFALNQQQPAAQSGTTRKRREVTIGGPRVVVVDVHSHVRVPEAWELVKDRIGREGRAGDMQQANPDYLRNIPNVDNRFANLAKMVIYVQSLS